MNIFFPPHQEIVAITTLIIGVIIGIFYDALVIKRMLLGSGKAVVFIDDMLFMLVSSVVFVMTVFVTNNGVIRWYEFLCCILGFTIYKLTLSKLVLGLFRLIIKLIKFILKTLLKVAITLVKFILSPVFKILKIIGALLWRLYLPYRRKRFLIQHRRNIVSYINKIGC